MIADNNRIFNSFFALYKSIIALIWLKKQKNSEGITLGVNEYVSVCYNI